jgi:hypothetical protein
VDPEAPGLSPVDDVNIRWDVGTRELSEVMRPHQNGLEAGERSLGASRPPSGVNYPTQAALRRR